jgi:iron complex outermembrane recepter protein
MNYRSRIQIFVIATTTGWSAMVLAAVTDDITTRPSATSAPSADTPNPVKISGQRTEHGDNDLTSLSIEDLMNVQVTSVTKAPQKISDAPAAITVIGQDDIQRSGMGSIAELLRLAPGMDVAHIDTNNYAITSRGMNGLLADDLLVLMDGRSLYTPAFGGVAWRSVGYPLPDLDRIEVIRGPGSTLWGSNAVNGVVNIITKSAKDTQGILLDTRGGSQQDYGTAQYGGQIDDKTFYRYYAQYNYTGAGEDITGKAAHDQFQGLQSGFRIDRYASPDDTLTLQGDIYEQSADEITTSLPFSQAFTSYSRGGNLLGRWTHKESDRSDSSLQLYYDRQDQLDAPVGYYQDTFDAQFQNRFPLGERNEMTWGIGARDQLIQLSTIPFVTVSPDYLDEYILNGFAQDQLTIVPDRLQWYFGTKLEYNNLTNTEIQPSTRLLWTPDEYNSIWGAVSRSVRIPSFTQDTNLTLGPEAVGTEHPNAEATVSYELGYKVQPSKTVTMDVTGFYNDYRDLITTVPNLAAPGAIQYGNAIAAQTFGSELSANWQATPWWRLGASYTYLMVHAQIEHKEFADQFIPQSEAQSIPASSPQNQFQIHSYMDLIKHVQLNTSLYYVDKLATLNAGANGSQSVPSYFRLDMNVRWQINENFTATVGVQNLLEKRHFEYGSISSPAIPSEVPRTAFAQLTLSF